MTRDEAILLLKNNMKGENLLKHCYATEAVMTALAEKLGQDKEKWALAGLLHDLDAEWAMGDLMKHGTESVRILKENNVDPEIIEAIWMHNEGPHGVKRSKMSHFALAAGEVMTGMITATTLVYPDKKLASVKTKSITKRMKEPRFAVGVNRDIIRECEKLGLTLDEFAEICLKAMLGISDKLGL